MKFEQGACNAVEGSALLEYFEFQVAKIEFSGFSIGNLEKLPPVKIL